MLVCVGRGADLHMAQLIPLPLTGWGQLLLSLKSKIWDQTGLIPNLRPNLTLHNMLTSPTVSCYRKSRFVFGFTFLVLAHLGSPGQNPASCKTVVVVVAKCTSCCRQGFNGNWIISRASSFVQLRIVMTVLFGRYLMSLTCSVWLTASAGWYLTVVEGRHWHTLSTAVERELWWLPHESLPSCAISTGSFICRPYSLYRTELKLVLILYAA